MASLDNFRLVAFRAVAEQLSFRETPKDRIARRHGKNLGLNQKSMTCQAHKIDK